MNHRKLTIYNRIRLQAGLEQYLPIQQIALDLHVHRSSIYRELVLHRSFRRVSYNGNLCDFKETMIVCNRCPKYAKCRCAHWIYDFQDAQREAENDRSSTRHHSRLSQDIIERIDKLVTPGILRGQSLHHIYVSIPELWNLCSEQTIRRLCYANQLSFKAHQLRRYVSYPHRHSHCTCPLPTRNVALLVNRTYADFTHHVKVHPSANVVEFDSVIGKQNDQYAILTITFRGSNLQVGRLIRKQHAEDVVAQIQTMFASLPILTVRKCFAICICDNGIEFAKFPSIETNNQGEPYCRTFFTNPYRATDKAHCERNHEFIRYIIPKGKSLNDLTQDQINTLFSHINSYVRKSLKNKTPYDVFARSFGADILNKLGIQRIPNHLVNLTPTLLH